GHHTLGWDLLPRVNVGVMDGFNSLLIRLCIDDPHQKTYYLVFAPPATPLQKIVSVVGARWHVEEDLQATKDLGLDQYEVRKYIGWYRHITLVMLAAAFLVSICVQESYPLPAPSPTPVAMPAPAVIALTTREVRHLLAR